jgi:hypothetical protein
MNVIVVAVLGLVCGLLVITGLVAVAAALVLARRKAPRQSDGEDEPAGPSEM